ncbi:MAG: response regulator transcription factor [Chloroflexota bacterium]
MKHILLIDDEPVLTEPLTRHLQNAGFKVTVAGDGRSGLEKGIDLKPDLVILDVMMPGVDGWAVCRQLRERSTVPILMLTALSDDFDRITGLELGADYYLSKPFSTNVLLAQINALLRRVELDRVEQEIVGEVISADPVTIDLGLRIAHINGEPLHLRYKEFELLSMLVANAGKPVSRTQIFNEVWGTDWLGDTRTLDVHVRWLREKLEENPSKPTLICTVRSVGYVFNPQT